MSKARGRKRVRDAAALAESARAEELEQRATRLDDEIGRLLAPLKDQLSDLVVERDRLLYEALVTRQKFFQAAKRADPNLDEHRSLRYERKREKVYVVWDESGPQFSTEERAELPQLHPFIRRRPGRRALDLFFWLR